MFGGIFFFKQKTAYEMRISDWSSDVCSSDLCGTWPPSKVTVCPAIECSVSCGTSHAAGAIAVIDGALFASPCSPSAASMKSPVSTFIAPRIGASGRGKALRSEEHTSELQSLMRISYAVFCLQKTKSTSIYTHHKQRHNIK